jgi:hypothetical protein
MVLDLGLLGGWAAGGLAVEAGNTAKSPAGAADAANADVAALAGAFRQLVDAFADESAAGGIGTATVSSATEREAPSATPSIPAAIPDMFQPNAATVDEVSAFPLRRFTPAAAAVSPMPESHDDESDRVEIPFSLFAPALDLRIDADRTVSTKTANSPVDKDAESESDVEGTERSPVGLTPTPMPVSMPAPTMTEATPAASIDANTTLTNRSTAHESAPRLEVPEGDAPRHAIRADGRPSASAAVESASPQNILKPTRNSARSSFHRLRLSPQSRRWSRFAPLNRILLMPRTCWPR